MKDHTSKPGEVRNKINRRDLLRDSAIAATGAVLLPSIITGCSKEDTPPGGGLGGVQDITPEQLKAAADNLNRMRAMLSDLYQNAYNYDEVVFLALASTKENGSWTNFIYDIFIDIAFLAAAATAVISGGAGLVPAFAFLSAILHDWGIGKDTPAGITGLNGFFSGYQAGQLAMKEAIDKQLGHLTEPGDKQDYPNLQAAWTDPIVFNDKSYTLGDLANSYFPEKTDNADEYYQLYDPMYDHHKKSVWNLAIMKCCWYYRHYGYWEDTAMKPAGVLLSLARDTLYKDSKGSYFRAEMYSYGGINNDNIRWWIYQYDLGIDGYPFPDAASAILFKDDTPGHIINPDGLFNRDYVFKQFSVTKPVFVYGHELGNDQIGNLNPAADDWTFTGGLFPKLIQ